MERASEIAAALQADPAEESLWRELEASEEQLREAVVDALKADIDATVRREPPAALPLAELIARAGPLAPRREALACCGVASVMHFNERREEALAAYLEARELYAKAGEEVEAARVERSLVDVYQFLGQVDEALAVGAHAREVFQRHGERRLLAQTDLNLGNVFTRLDDYPEARRAYAASRDVFAELDDRLGITFAEFNLGIVEMNSNHVEEAARALRVAREGMAAVGMEMHVADCDYNLAYLESRRGNFEAATRGLERSRESYRRNGKPSGVPLCDLDLAEIHLRLDARRDALAHARSAAAAFDGLGLAYEQARAEVMAGLALSRLGELEQAREQLRSARARLEALGNESWAAVARLQAAAIELELGAAAALEEELRAVRDLLEQRGLALPADLATLTLARALLQLERAAEARLELQPLLAAEGQADHQVDELVRAEALRLVADAALAAGEEGQAIEHLRAAVEEIERSYRGLDQSDIRLAFFRDRYPAFADLAELLARDPAPPRQAEALAVFERSRSRSLAEERCRRARPGADSQRLREELDWLLSRRLDSTLGPASGEHELRSLAPTVERIDAARRAYHASLEAGAATRAEDLGGLDLEALRAACGRDDLVLTYLFSKSGGRVFLLSREGVESRALAIGEAELRSLRERLWLQINKLALGAPYFERQRERLTASVQRILADFGAALLEPIAGSIAGRSLLVVPCGELHELPFHAFRVAGRALVETSEVAYGLSTWHAAACRSGEEQGRGCVHATAVRTAGLEQLPAELEDLRALYGEQLVQLEPDVLLHRLAEGDFAGGVLHLAGHAEYEARSPVFSGVCLGEHFLLAHDLESTRLDLDLVCLSGCETGRRLRVGGEELFGLPRALLAAGARAVLGSLWPVGDQEARSFMRVFHGALARGEALRTAVASASRSLLAEGAHPFAWAPFVLLGNPDLRFPVQVVTP